MRIRILLADDHTMFREALRGLIEAQLPEAEIVGEAETGAETLRLCRNLLPAILVLDLSMPDLGGFDVLGQLPHVSPQTKSIIVSQYTDSPYVVRCLRLGAKAYLPKSGLTRDLVAAIRKVAGGGSYLDTSVVDAVVAAAAHPERHMEPEELAALTSREREVLRLTAEGKVAREIGAILGISPHTVNRHRSSLMEKLDLHNKTDLVKLAVKLRWVDP